MTAKQESIQNSILRALEILCAAFFAFLGSAAVVLFARTTVYLIGELLWRLPKGEEYLHWDIVSIAGLFIISAAMLGAAFLIIARAFWRGHWSRRIILSAISLAAAGFCTFLAYILVLGAGFSQID